MKKIVAAVFMVLFVTGFAWGAPFLACDPQEGVVGYTLTGLTDKTIAAQPDGSLKYDLAPLANGSYSVTVAACNVWGCSEPAAPFPVVKKVPVAPVGLRITAQ